MAKNEIGEFDEVDANNLDIQSISLAENVMRPPTVNNAFRAQMGALKRWFKSSLFRLRDSTDQTKLLAFDLSGITTATTRTLTAPNASGTVMLTSTPVANAQQPIGAVVSSSMASYDTNANLSTVIPYDDTVPTSAEGTQILSVTLSPTSTTNLFRCRFRGSATGSVATLGLSVAMFSGGAAAIAAAGAVNSGIDIVVPMNLEHEFTPGVLTPVTITVRAGPSSGNMRFNGSSSARIYGGVSRATLVVEEIKAP